jgi:trimeric autotransporter adhesin
VIQPVALLRSAVIGGLLATAASCGGGKSEPITPPTVVVPPEPLVSRIELSSPRNTIAAGKSFTLSVTAYDAAGVPVTRKLAWSSSDSSVASVSDVGVVRALSAGSAQLRASASGTFATVLLVVRPAGPVFIEGAELPQGLRPEATFQLGPLVAKDWDGDVVSPVRVRWEVSDSAIATVSPTGLFTAIRTGLVSLRITVDTSTFSQTVVIKDTPIASFVVEAPSDVAIGDSVRARAIVRDSAGNPITYGRVLWYTNDQNIATVSQDGVVRGQRVGGPVNLAAAYLGSTVFKPLRVVPSPVVSVTLTPTSSTIVDGAVVRVEASMRNALGEYVSNLPVSFSSSAPAVAAIREIDVLRSSDVVGLSAGTAIITATVGNVRGTMTVTVIPRITRVVLRPDSATLEVGRSFTLAATLFDAAGNPRPERPTLWRTTDASVATVSSTGVVTATGNGNVVVTAYQDQASATAAIFAFSRLTMVPDAGLVVIAARTSLVSAYLRDAAGNRVPTGAVTWQSSDRALVDFVQVDTTTILLGMSPGAAMITASVGGFSVTRSVRVFGNSRDVCNRIAGGSLLSNDDVPIFLGLITKPTDPQSVFNRDGAYGSPMSPFSIYNPNGRYGSATGDFSARNPFATQPPFVRLIDRDTHLLTLDPSELLGVTPQYALTCALP